MREYPIRINNDGTVDVSSVNQYIGEHSATKLAIELNDELKATGIRYYTLCFGAGADSAYRYCVKFSSDAITDQSPYGYTDGGKLYFAIPQALTVFSTLQVQVEAHSLDGADNLIRTVKSPVFEVKFNKSVMGEETIIPERRFGIIEEMRKALDRINSVSAELDAMRKEIEGFSGSVDEIEALIDESGVLE